MAKLKSINPANGKELGSVKIVTKAEVEEVIKQARDGFLKWKQTSLAKRAKIMIKAAMLLEQNAERLGKMITKEMGKPLKAGIGEVKNSAEEVRYLAKKAHEVLQDEVIEPKLTVSRLKQINRLKVENRIDYLTKKGIKVCSVIRYDPIGVVGMIKPWNYPVNTVSVSLVSALMAGNSVVLKPSEYVSLVSNELVKIFWQAGVPKDVLQVIFGRSQVGAMLVGSEIDMVSFTGSSEVGKEIAEKCSQGFKKCVLEMGGSSPAIVCRDADLDLAANAIVYSRFNNCGQVCEAIKRVFVEEIVSEKLIEKLAEKIRKLTVGDPMDKNIDIGPLVGEKQLKKLQIQVTRGVVQSGRIIVGGRRMREEPFISGYYHEPTLMINVTPKMDIMQEEVFGPILPINIVNNFKTAIKFANQSKYGLTAVCFTKSKLKAEKAMRKLKAGAVCINEVEAWNVKACFGGVKESGMGVELGKHGIWGYTQIKHIKVNNSSEQTRDYWFKV